MKRHMWTEDHNFDHIDVGSRLSQQPNLCVHRLLISYNASEVCVSLQCLLALCAALAPVTSRTRPVHVRPGASRAPPLPCLPPRSTWFAQVSCSPRIDRASPTVATGIPHNVEEPLIEEVVATAKEPIWPTANVNSLRRSICPWVLRKTVSNLLQEQD